MLSYNTTKHTIIKREAVVEEKQIFPTEPLALIHPRPCSHFVYCFTLLIKCNKIVTLRSVHSTGIMTSEFTLLFMAHLLSLGLGKSFDKFLNMSIQN